MFELNSELKASASSTALSKLPVILLQKLNHKPFFVILKYVFGVEINMILRKSMSENTMS